jgi:Bax protein
MNHLCATLLLLCSSFNMFFNDERNYFIQEIGICAVEYNAYYTEPEKRLPIRLVIAVAAHESGWGTSRFALEGNNYFGMKTRNEDPDEHMIPNENKKVRLAKYKTTCGSVYGFMDLLSKSKKYKGFREKLMEQWFLDDINYVILIKTLNKYSKDKLWSNQVIKIIKQLEVK